jgi:hypothetical protein
MSSLYNEVLADAKKIREIAVQDARNSIMEEIIPLVNKMIAEEIANPSAAFEDDDTTEDAEPMLPGVDTQTATPVLPADPTAVMPPVNDIAPSVPPVDMGLPGGLNLAPDANGKITISLKDLMDCLQSKMSPTADAPMAVDPLAAMPPPAVDPLVPATDVPPPVDPLAPAPAPAADPQAPFYESKKAMSLKVSLTEKITSMEELVSEVTSEKDANLIKDSVFVLFSKLQETSSLTSNEKRILEKRLEKLYDKVDVLLESTIYGKTNVKVKDMKTNKTATSLKDLLEDASDSLSEDMELDEDMELAELFGETSEDAEEEDGEEDENDLEECGEMPGEDGLGGEGDVELEIVDDTADPMAMEGRDLDDDMIVEISESELREALASLTEELGADDEETEEVDEDADLDLEGSSVTDDIFADAVNAPVSKTPAAKDTKEPKTPTMEGKSSAQNMQLKSKLQEADRKLRAAHTQLVETNLLNAKLLYTTQFLKHGGLTEGQMSKIVECLDACSSVDEAKETFNKLAKKLNERKTTMTESVKRQSLKPAAKPVLREQVGVEENNVLIEGVVDDERWARLAGITRPNRR